MEVGRDARTTYRFFPMTFKRFLASTAIATIAAAFPMAALANDCPAPPPEMRWNSWTGGGSAVLEISINRQPYVICKSKTVGDALGTDYYKTIYSCPTFTAINTRGGYAGTMRSVFNRFEPKFHEEWDVIDKNKNKFSIYKEILSQPKPKTEKIINVTPKGCEVSSITEITSPTITLTTRVSWVEILEKKPVPTF